MQKGCLRPCVLCTVLSSDSVSLCPLTRTKKGSNQESMQSRTRMIKIEKLIKIELIKIENAVFGLRAPQPKKNQGSSH